MKFSVLLMVDYITFSSLARNCGAFVVFFQLQNRCNGKFEAAVDVEDCFVNRRFHYNTMLNDIALIKLKRKIYYQPVFLPRSGMTFYYANS